MEFPDHLKYTKEHEWTRVENGSVVVGVTDYAQDSLGEVVYVELREEGNRLPISLLSLEYCGGSTVRTQ